ncbi:MAG: MOSC domain-containing protein [Ktedonobacterales bacterium]|nr:MOSC domain-containing protein [Ktedonobacterales bacterium]
MQKQGTLIGRVLSVQVGLPRTVPWQGRHATTAIFKEPVAGAVAVGHLNLAGDAQADLSVHGGPDKAIYCYPTEHYPFWHEQLPEVTFPPGAFGENLTTEGVQEDTVAIGDRWRIGTAVVEVTQPRLPCFKLAVRFGRRDMLRRFLASGRTGLYLRVVQEGQIAAGDAIEHLACGVPRLTVAGLTRLILAPHLDHETLQRALAVAALPQVWRAYFTELLRHATA